MSTLAREVPDAAVTDSPAMFATSFPPNATLVGAVRRFVFTFYARMLGDPDNSSRVALATHELLENAVCYCASGDVTLRVSVAPSRSGHLVRVRTRNAASRAHITSLEHIVAQLGTTNDPVLFYQDRMQQTVREQAGSGLGLPRIRAEAGMEIECAILGSDVEITAQTLLTQAQISP